MFSKNKLFLALGIVGLAFFSARGKAREMAAGAAGDQNKKDSASGEGRNRNLPSTITYPTSGTPSP